MTIILDHISKSYNGKTVLDNFYAEIEWGRAYAIVGPAGSGKSTVLKIFMGTEEPDSGRVCRMGDYKYPSLHSAYVSQHGQLNPKKNAVWNVKKAHRWSTKTRAMEELSRFLSEERMHVPVSELTDVERRFTEIVRAAFLPADFLVMDEPFLGMTEEERKRALDYIEEFRGTRPLLIAAEDEQGLSFARIYHLK